MMDLKALLQALVKAQVEFIVVGGVSASAHGSARSTSDLDVVYRRTPDNIAKLAAILKPFHPYLRGAPPGLPFLWDGDAIRRGLNFTLTTDLGDLDLLGELTGGGTYERLFPFSAPVRIAGADCRCLGLEKLIEVKRAAGRPKDLEVIAELEALREERDRQGP